jgi:hypothetical protein
VQTEDAGAGSIVHQNNLVKASSKPVLVLSQHGATPDDSGHWKANLLPTKITAGALNKIKSNNGGTVPTMRSSKRTATTTDQDSLEKAIKLKAQKNLDSAPTKGKKSQPCSFITRDDSSLLLSTKSLGVVLGDSEHAVSVSLQTLREVELSRLNESATSVEENNVLIDDTSTFCSHDDILDLESLNLICSEISEGLGDGGCDPMHLQTPVSHKRSSHSRRKKNNNKNKSF